MNSCNVIHNWSDAWLLLSIIYANHQGDVTLDKIIAAGDAINHAIFTPEELESGLARLTESGFIEGNGGRFFLAKDAQLPAKLARTRRSMHNELNDVAALLGTPSAIDDQPSENNLSYPSFSVSAYNDAVDKYRRSVQTVF